MATVNATEDKRLPAFFVCQRLRIKQREIAALSGVDQSGVSKTLNGLEHNKKVLRAVRQLVSPAVATDIELFGFEVKSDD